MSLPAMNAPGHSDWRLILGTGVPDGPGVGISDGPTNMATDEALMQAVAAGAPPVLRFYRWSPPTLSFGRNQAARGLYDRSQAGGRGIAFVRRPTGGQAVLHDDELTYAVVAPVAVVGKPRAAYARINEALVEGLGQLGVPAQLAGAGLEPAVGGPSPDWAAACFRRPERGEVMASGRKLVGSAQRVESRTILQHGSILLGGSQAAAEDLLVGGSIQPADQPEGWTTLEREMARRPGPDELVAALVSGFQRVLGIRLTRSTLSAAEAQTVGELRDRYESDAWTWRQ